MGHDSKTEDQKRIKQNCFHRGYVRRCGYFVGRSDSRRWPAAGKKEKWKKHSLSFSANLTKRTTGLRKNGKTRGMGTTALNFWRPPFGVSYKSATRPVPKNPKKVLDLEFLDGWQINWRACVLSVLEALASRLI